LYREPASRPAPGQYKCASTRGADLSRVADTAPRHCSAGARQASGGVGVHIGAPHPNDALRLENVTRVFGALTAIENISFSVAAGERRAVIGANGAGKTTLFNVVTGDFPATSGRVLFFGEDVTATPPHERIRM